MLSTYFSYISKILFSPRTFFKNVVVKERDFSDSFYYYALLLPLTVFLGGFLNYLLTPYYLSLFSSLTGISFPSIPLSSLLTFINMITGYIFGLALVFLSSLVLHGYLYLLGAREDFSKAMQVYVYSRTPSLLLGWIPGVNLFTWIYSLILLIIGVETVYGFSRKKTVLAFVLPTVILFIFAILLFIFILYFLRNFAPLISQSMMY